MYGTDSHKAIQPCVQADDSFAVDQSFTQPDRQSLVENNPNYYHLFNLMNLDNRTIETPKSNSMMNVSDCNVGEQLPYDVESNRSSVLFERSQTHREKQSETKSNNKEDYIKITSLKELLRLFRINMSENDTFQFNGQNYVVELDESFVANTPTHHDQVYQPIDTKAMPRNEENYFSPVKYNHNFDEGQQNNKNHNRGGNFMKNVNHNTHSLKASSGMSSAINTSNQLNINLDSQSQISSKSGVNVNVDFQDIHLFETSNQAGFNLMNIPSQDTTPVTSHQVSMQQRCETFDKEIQVDEKSMNFELVYASEVQKTEIHINNGIQQTKIESIQEHSTSKIIQNPSIKVEEHKKTEEEKKQDEVDDFYANIAKQLALEIELEEMEELEAEEEKKKNEEKKRNEKQMQEQKVFESSSTPSGGGHQKGVKSEFIDTSNSVLNFHKNSTNMIVQEQTTLLGNNRDSIAQSIESAAAENPKLKRFMSMGDAREIHRFDKSAQSKLKQMNSKNQELQEQLNQAKQQLESIGQTYIGKNGDRNISDAPLHLAFLFASPLVMRQSGVRGVNNGSDNFSTVPLLEFGKEFKEIKQSILETKRVLRIRNKQATIENLSLILSQNPLALHFSGHGLENSKENFGRQHKQRQGDGNYLLFETEDGEGELVSEKMLQEFIQSSNTRLEFVFVASCYSEFAGKIFLNTGAKHVICVRSGEQIADQAVITFSKSFYNSVFSQTMTICDAFQMAQKQVQVKFGLQESNKFSILILDSSSPHSKSKTKINNLFDSQSSSTKTENSSNSSHKCKVFGPLKQGVCEFLELNPRFKEYPAKVDNFIGRQKEIFEVVHNVHNHRLVNIIGLPGIGKTSLSKNAVHYIVDRKLFNQGVIFMQLKGYISFEVFMKKLVVSCVMSNFDLDKDKKKEVQESNIEQLLTLTLNYLKNQEDNLLLVFDNVEDLLYHDKKAFRIFINDLLVQVQNLHILMTSRTTLGTLQDINEKILVLQELSPYYTVDLFISRSRELKDDEKKELLEYYPENQLLVVDMPLQKNQQVKNLADHHLFKIFGGNPHAITLAAPLLIRMRLKELYMLLNTKEMYNVLKVDGIEDSTVASLRLSLEVSIKVLQNDDTQALQFFFLIGMLPGGIEDTELAEIWGIDYKKHLDSLMNLSLVQKKETKGSDTVKVILPPFMSNYADAKISQEDKILFQNDICHYYSKICQRIYNSNGKSIKKSERTSELNHQVMDKLLKHETNIYACIYRMVDAKPQEKIDDEIQEGLEEDVEVDQLQNQQSQRLRRISTLMQQIEVGDYKRAQTMAIKNQRQQDLTQKDIAYNTQKQLDILDSADVRPFQIMTSQTPRTEQGKNFMFPVENEQKASVSLLPPRTQIIDEEDLSDNLSQEDEDAEEFYPKQKSQPKRDNSALDISFQNNQQDTLNHIIRNSYVNFQRQSFNPGYSQLMQMMKSPDIEKKALQRRQTLGRNDFSNNFQQNHSYNRKKVKIEELHAAEQLIIFYVMNLFLLHENDNAIHMIKELALKAHGGTLYEANIHRVLGLIYHNKTNITEALEQFKISKKLYKQCNSQYGVALSKFSIGYIYRSKIAEFIIKLDEEVILKRSKKKFQGALLLFQSLNHIVGQALCHQQLSFIDKSLSNKKESGEHAKQHQRLMIVYTKYTNKKDCPFIARVHGNEISLMTEIVLDNETKNMFPPSTVTPKRIKTTQNSNSQFSDLQMPTQETTLGHHNSVKLKPNKNIVQPQLKPQESMDAQQTDYSPIIKNQKLNRNDSYSSIDIAQEQVQLFKDTLSQKPTHSHQNISPQTPNLITDETSMDSIQSVIQDKTGSSQTNLVAKQQSIQLTSKLMKMVSTLDIVEEEDESLRPSVTITVESTRQSKIFNSSFAGQEESSFSQFDKQATSRNIKELNNMSKSTNYIRDKSLDKKIGYKQEEQKLLSFDQNKKAQEKLNNSANKIRKTTPKKQLNTVVINPKSKL